MISLEQRSQINHKLKKLGFGGISDPNLFTQIATLYKTHDSFRGLLMSTMPDQRRIAYESLKPHLCFAAKPLDQYEREMKEKAEREQWDVVDPKNPHFPKAFEKTEVETPGYRLEKVAQEALAQNRHEKAGGLHLTCAKCMVVEIFRAKDRKQAEKDSHRAGWRSDGRSNWCPAHVLSRCTMTLLCVQCGKEEKLRCWEPQDGYAKARLAGWVIEDEAKCPGCSVKLVSLQ